MNEALFLQDRTALVTGGSGAIGRACVEALTALGARVAVGWHARPVEPPAGALSVQIDVRDDVSVRHAFDCVEKDLGDVEILVNCAGILRERLAFRTREPDWQEVLETNLGGTFRCCRRALPAMLRHRFGRIVNVSSPAARLGPPGQAAYAASKGGVEALTRVIAREGGAHGVTANSVVPGFVASEMTRGVSQERQEEILRWSATKQAVSPAQVADAIVLCIRCDAITGKTIEIDAGLP